MSLTKTFFTAMIEIGVASTDEPASRQKKRGLTLIALICAPAALLIGVGLLFMGYPTQALVPFAYLGISIPSLFHFARTGNVRFFQYSQLILIQLLPFVLTWAMGGFAASSMVMVWGAFAPIAALIFFNQRAARLWLLGFVALTAISVLIDHRVSAWAIHLHWLTRDLFYFLNIGCAAAGLWFVVAHHVTEKERVNEKLLEELDRREQIQAEVVRQKQKAEVANLAKSNFLARMSHEIRTPMNAILGLAYVLEHEIADSAQRSRLSKITDSATHLLDLLNNILDFSKIEANSLELEEIPLGVPEALDNVANMMRDLASEKALDLLTEVDPQLVGRPLLGDPLRVRQVLINFTNNAIKFTPQGSITIRARLTETDGDRVKVRFEVTDTGIGVPDVAQSRIFDAFEQADTGTTRQYGGSGLGLSIAKGFAGLMGGEVGLTSQPGQGSTFWFTALLRQAPVAAVAPLKPGGSLRQGARVLMVEDNEINQEVAMALLQRMGLVVDVANHGEEALEKVRSADYDLVLMDMWMPVMDGLEATRRIRALGKSMPIVAMTANAMQQDKDNCSAAGMDDFMQKPVDPKKLQGCLARWIPDTP